jgi:hypothetical protein
MTNSYCVALELNKTVADLCAIPDLTKNPGFNLLHPLVAAPLHYAVSHF